MIEVPIAWMLAALLSLCSVIAALAGIIWRSMQSRLDAQDKLIEHFRADIERLSKGCGIVECFWKKR